MPALARFFTLDAYRLPVPDQLEGAIGKWSRAGTYGDKTAKGPGLVFDVAALSSLIDNAAARGDEIGIDQDHKTAYVESTGRPAPSLGFFHAMALFKQGELLKHWARDGADPPVAIGYDGKARDGLYFRLGRITPLGYDPKEGLANYSSLSLMFSWDGKGEDNRDIGPSLVCVAATSSAFLAGTAIAFNALAPITMRVEHKDGRYYVVSEEGKPLGDYATESQANERLREVEAAKAAKGLTAMTTVHVGDYARGARGDWQKVTGVSSDGSQAELVDARGSKSWGPTSSIVEVTNIAPQGFASMSDAARVTSTTSKGAIKMDDTEMARRFGFEPDDDDDKKAEKEKAFWAGHDAMAKKLSEASSAAGAAITASADAPDKKDDDKDKAMTAMSAKMAAVEASNAALMARLASVEAIEKARSDQAEAVKLSQIEQLADAAIEGGYPKDARDAFITFAKGDMAAATKLAAPHLKNGPPAHLFGRLTSQGAPLGAPGDNGSARQYDPTASPSNKPVVRETKQGTFVERDAALAEKAREFAASKDPIVMSRIDAKLGRLEREIPYKRLMIAQDLAKELHPDLVPPVVT